MGVGLRAFSFGVRAHLQHGRFSMVPGLLTQSYKALNHKGGPQPWHSFANRKQAYTPVQVVYNPKPDLHVIELASLYYNSCALTSQTRNPKPMASALGEGSFSRS